MRIEWLGVALNDLDQALEYIAEDDPATARQVAGRVRAAAVHLCDQPGMGRAGRISGTREWVVCDTSLIIAYRARGEALEILRVLHSARQWPSAFD